MCLVVTFFLLNIAVALFFIHRSVRKPQNFPPGPYWLPFAGNIFYIRKLVKQLKYLHTTFTYLSQKYNSPIIGLKLGENLTVVVSGSELIHEVLTKEEYEGRPDNFFIRLRSMGTRRGITCTDGILWQKQRAFVLRHLRNLGYGKYDMDTIIASELVQLKSKIDVCKEEKLTLGPLLASSVLNVLWTLVAGARLSSFNLYLDKILQLLDKRAKIFDMSGGLLNHFPWLRFFAPKYSGYNVILDMNRELKTLFQEIINEHGISYSSHQTRDLIDAFLHQMKTGNREDEEAIYTEDQLIMICLDLFIAGSQTTSNTIGFVILLMALYPDVQSQVREEIWSVYGKEEPPSLKNRSKLPYVNAVLMESYRLCHVNPIAGPRRALKETTLFGYTIPKDTSILINLDSVHKNECYWKDANSFRPERFQKNYGTCMSEENLIIFGLGRRRCLGELLARSCVFTFFTGILQHYYVRQAPGELLSINPVPGMTLSPTPYSVILTPVEET